MPLDQKLNSLGFAKAPSETRVVVAMSGGVDSSVVAAKLAEEGYDVVGVTLQLYDHGAALAKKGACCAGIDIHDARRVAEEMGFPHYVLDYENIFQDAVIDEFADSYLAGATPVPCIRCNERVKFKDLLETAKDLDADCMATGHYIQRIDGPNGPELHSAADANRDQSYFLFSTTPEQLSFLRFPLGHLPSKDETRKLAAKYGLPVADIDHAGILAGAADHPRRGSGQLFQMPPRGFVRAVLRPHDRKDAQLHKVGLAAHMRLDALIFVLFKAVLGDDFRGDGGHNSLWDIPAH